MVCKATDLGIVSKCFRCIQKIYWFETRKQKTDWLVAVNHSSTMSSQVEREDVFYGRSTCQTQWSTMVVV